MGFIGNSFDYLVDVYNRAMLRRQLKLIDDALRPTVELYLHNKYEIKSIINNGFAVIMKKEGFFIDDVVSICYKNGEIVEERI